MFSGRLAARTFKSLNAAKLLETVILLGADHTGAASKGEVFDSGGWQMPLGNVQVDNPLASKLLAASTALRSNPNAHTCEHSIEVQIPLLQILNPKILIVPITVPPTDLSVEIGQAIGKVLKEISSNVRVVGSTDLTHHGGHFPAPGGRGVEGMNWTVKNDRRMLDLIEQMAAEKIIEEAQAHQNACGAGAIAATVAAAREMGATRGYCIEYTNSYQVVHAAYPDDPDDTTVGYASVVFG
jgi:AmmeMemoRadiSam system protein B